MRGHLLGRNPVIAQNPVELTSADLLFARDRIRRRFASNNGNAIAAAMWARMTNQASRAPPPSLVSLLRPCLSSKISS